MIRKKICGIYKITSPIGKIYIGQSVNITKRFYDYKSLQNCNEQLMLFNSFNKYGVNYHKFEIIHICEPNELNELEVNYINLYESLNKNKGLNIRGGGDNPIMTEETKNKISKALKGKPKSITARTNMSKSKKGKPTWNKGLKGVQIAWNKGIKMPEQQRLNQTGINSFNFGKKQSEESNEKRSNSLKGRKKTKEHLENISKALKGRVMSYEWRKKISESNKLKKQLKK
jgi:group I intron endonuclease